MPSSRYCCITNSKGQRKDEIKNPFPFYLGTSSLLSMVVIGYDRYSVIVNGYSGRRITPFSAFLGILSIWLYSCVVCCPPFIGWGGYMLEGLFMTCSYDYLSEDWNRKSFILYAFIFNYCFPMLIVIFFYTQIVRAVVVHESALKSQAKKMNVESLRSNEVFVLLLPPQRKFSCQIIKVSKQNVI